MIAYLRWARAVLAATADKRRDWRARGIIPIG
jgi:hypothetical protein